MSEPRSRRWQMASDLAPWFWVCARYPSAQMARGVWERVDRKRKQGAIGVYRHGPHDDQGTHITVVGLDRAEVDRVARLLRHGEDVRLADELVERMCLRRAEVVVEAVRAARESGQPTTGRIKIRRPEDRGEVLGPDGVMRPYRKGQG